MKNKLSFFNTVFFKISFVVCLIISLVFGLTNLYIFDKISQQSKNGRISDIKNKLEFQQRQIALEFEIIGNLTKTIAQDSMISDYLSNSNGSFETILRHLHHYNSTKNYDSIYLLDKDGMALISTDQSFIDNDYSFRDYFKDARSDKVIIYTALGITSKKIGYYFSYPIYSKTEDTSLLGVVVIKVGTRNIEKMLHQFEGVDFFLVDEYGVITFSKYDDLLLKSMGKSPYLDKLTGIDESKYLGQNIVSLNRDEDWYDMQTLDEQVVFQNTSLHNDEETIFVSQRIYGSNYYIVSSQPEDSIFGPVRNFGKEVLFNLIVVSIITSFLLIFVIAWFLIPLKKLVSHINVILEGKYFQFNKLVKSNDEFEFIYESFVNLRKKVDELSELQKSKNDDRENALQEKIDELERLNSVMVNRELEIINLKNQINSKKI